jgi:hypothetical protein
VTDGPDPGADRDAAQPGRWRRIGAAAVAVEAALVLAGAVALAVHAATGPAATAEVTSTANPVAVDLTLAGGALLLAAGLGWCARGLSAAAAWSRGPLLTWQLIQVAVAVQTLRGRAAMPLPDRLRLAAGVLLLVLGVLVLLGLSRSGLTRPGAQPADERVRRRR